MAVMLLISSINVSGTGNNRDSSTSDAKEEVRNTDQVIC